MKKLIDGLQKAVTALQDFLVRLIEAIKHLSNIIVNLVIMGMKIIFYIAPFALMVIIGGSKHWWWMAISGGFMLVLILVFSLGKGVPNEKEDNSIKKINHLFSIITFCLSVYSILFFSLNISLENELLSLVKKGEGNPKANLIREAQYLDILTDSTKPLALCQEAIQELGKLHS